MNPGDSVEDAIGSGTDAASRPGGGPQAAAGQGSGQRARSPESAKPLQDIQDIIDRLAAVTQQLRHPGSMAGRPPRDPEARAAAR
jgi:hypothetical protein